MSLNSPKMSQNCPKMSQICPKNVPKLSQNCPKNVLKCPKIEIFSREGSFVIIPLPLCTLTVFLLIRNRYWFRFLIIITTSNLDQKEWKLKLWKSHLALLHVLLSWKGEGGVWGRLAYKIQLHNQGWNESLSANMYPFKAQNK